MAPEPRANERLERLREIADFLRYKLPPDLRQLGNADFLDSLAVKQLGERPQPRPYLRSWELLNDLADAGSGVVAAMVADAMVKRGELPNLEGTSIGRLAYALSEARTFLAECDCGAECNKGQPFCPSCLEHAEED